MLLESDLTYELYRVVGGRVRYECEDRGFDTPCWIWRMWVEPIGYAYCKAWGGRAHRGLYKLLVRDPGPSVVLHHRCEQLACVNPWHMSEMTQLEHNRLHKLGRKMNLSESERQRRREHGREMGLRLGGKHLYTKQTRSEVQRRIWDNLTEEQREERRRKISAGRRKNRLVP
jgi:hypothetical protein